MTADLDARPPPDPAPLTSLFDVSGRRCPDARFDAWGEHISPFFDVDLPEGADRSRFRARLSLGLVGDLIVGGCEASGQSFARSPLRAAAEAHDHLMIQVFLGGDTRTRVGGREVIARPGDIWVIDMLEPMAAENSTFRNVSMVAPRALIGDALLNPGGHHLRAISGDEPVARIFASYLQTLVDSLDALSGEEAAGLVPATLRLAEALLNARPGEARPEIDPAGAERALMFAARRLIEERLADPALSPELVQQALGLSRARLYRAFAPLGGVASYIRARRLKRSLEDLLDPAMAHRPIYDIAYAWHFASDSDYSRAFRRRFGLSPREARQARQAEGPRPDAGPLAHERWLAELGR